MSSLTTRAGERYEVRLKSYPAVKLSARGVPAVEWHSFRQDYCVASLVSSLVSLLVIEMLRRANSRFQNDHNGERDQRKEQANVNKHLQNEGARVLDARNVKGRLIKRI
jgi:hypothetical protein